MAVVNADDALLDEPTALGVRMLTLNRPDKANALSDSLVRRVHELLDRVGTETRVLVITGAGSNFSGGFDFAGHQAQSEGDLLLRFVHINDMLSRLRQAPYATLAWVNGAAFGAGADIACSCAFRIGTKRARFRFPGFQFGVALGTRRLAELIGGQHARDVLARNEEIVAQRALEWGLLSEVADDAMLEVRAAEQARRVDGLDPEALRDLLRMTERAEHDMDLADLVRSVSRPGLHSRMARYRRAKAPEDRPAGDESGRGDPRGPTLPLHA